MLQSVISNESFQFTDRNRFSFDTTDTFSFALAFLGLVFLLSVFNAI